TCETYKIWMDAVYSFYWTYISSGFIQSMHPFKNYTYSDFTFEAFQVLDAKGQVESDYSGNEVTGIAPHVLSAGLDIVTRPGFYLNASYFFKSKTPLTDENDVYNDAYSVVNTKIGYERTINDWLKADISAGIKNL